MDYEALLEAFYRRLPLTGSTIIDVGAHVGRHAIPLSECVGREGIVHAFEPIPDIRSLLIQAIGDAGASNIILYPFALSDEVGPVQFHYLPNDAGESGIKARQSYIKPDARPELLDLYTRRLDDITPISGIDFIKIDIEGGELNMLLGAQRTLTISRPIVSFECGAEAFLGYHDRPEDIFGMFHCRGYEIYTILGKQIPDAAAFRQASHAQETWDYVAIPFEKASLASCLS